MTNSDIDSHCICYYAEHNQKATALNLLSFGCRNFALAKHVNELARLSIVIEGMQSSELRSIPSGLQEFIFENLLDAIKISICFENYMKAKLIVNGYVVHNISNEPLNSTLRNKQKEQPVSLKEIMEIHSWVKSERSEHYLLKCLTEHTIKFSTMLSKKGYRDVLCMPVDIVRIVREVGEKRNTLHYLTGEFGKYGDKPLADLRALIEFVESDIRALQNQMVDDLGEIPEKKLRPRFYHINSQL
jgi:hypothetical protein